MKQQNTEKTNATAADEAAKMRNYIERTGMTKEQRQAYAMTFAEVQTLRERFIETANAATPDDAILELAALAYELGRARGVRAERNQAKQAGGMANGANAKQTAEQATNLEALEKYIQRTHLPIKPRCGMRYSELITLKDLAEKQGTCEALAVAYDLGAARMCRRIKSAKTRTV